ncbi:MAG: trigger factor [Deltaproteobacteria bacterium]|nr:trigger factor [Deltaproteobacteria bacterium]MCB9479998.1 trigger factor [Deltaproteobacteria bacterium]MCB9489266.1 trigger factor [Deltaproteobacteria bacterium]
MDIKIEAVDSVKRKINITANADQVRNGRNKLFANVRKHANIRGFRPGKAPREILERHYGPQIEDELRADLINEGLRQAMDEHELQVVARPEVESSDFNDDGTFVAVATVEVAPDVEVKDYKSLDVKRQKVTVSDEQLDERLKQLAEMHSQMRTIEEARPVAEGDHAEIDFVGREKDAEEPFEGGSADNYLLKIGSGSFIPGFEDGVIGMTVGEEKDIELSFPEDYQAKQLAGKAVVFHVTLKAIKERVVPEIDDEFAKDLGGELAGLDDLKARERETLEEQAQRQARNFDRDQVVDALVARNAIDVPDAMVAQQIKHMMQNMHQQLMYSGIPHDQVHSIMEGSEDRMRPDAIKEVQAALLFEAVAKQEGLEATEADLEARFAELGKAWGKSPLQVSAEYQKEGRVEDLKYGIRQEKVLDFLLENAQVEWVEPAADDDLESGGDSESPDEDADQ